MQKQEISNIIFFFCYPGLERATQRIGNTPDTGERGIDGESTIYRISAPAEGNVQTLPRSKLSA